MTTPLPSTVMTSTALTADGGAVRADPGGVSAEPGPARQSRPDAGPAPRPVAQRVWASLEKDPEEVIEAAIREAKHRDPEQTQSWIALVDGQAH
jgi:hypothetical protein